jgi:hypothetical protein
MLMATIHAQSAGDPIHAGTRRPAAATGGG